MKNVVLGDTFVLLRLDIKNQEAFHRKIFKRGGEGGFCGVCFYFSCAPRTMHFTGISYYTLIIQNVKFCWLLGMADMRVKK
jgi:hypothetical protein